MKRQGRKGDREKEERGEKRRGHWDPPNEERKGGTPIGGGCRRRGGGGSLYAQSGVMTRGS